MRVSISRIAISAAWFAASHVLFGFAAAAQSSERPLMTALAEQSALTRAVKAKVLRVAWAQWPPLMATDPKTGKPAGFTIDLYESYLGPAMGVKIEWVEGSWSTLVAGLQADRYDVVANANRTYQRLLAAEYAGPLTTTGKALLTTRQNVAKYQGWQAADEPGTKICVALGSSADTAVTEFFKKAEIMRVEGDPACIAALAAGRADIYSTDLGVLQGLASTHEGFAVIPNSTFTKIELGIFVKQGDQVMLNWLNQFIREIKLNGGLDRLIKKYNLQGVEIAW
jgi:ABC-type amino acid transport substrate-binding protein